MTDQVSRREKWDTRFLQLAQLISSWSKDPTTKVGCVIVNSNDVVIGMGFNGFPQGGVDDEEILANKDRKRLRTVHAEMNALHFATGPIAGARIYVTHHPCAACVANLLQHKPAEINIPKGISELGKDWDASVKEAKAMLEEYDVHVYEIPLSTPLTFKDSEK